MDDQIRLRREATETVLRNGIHDGVGPAHWWAQLDRRYQVRPHTKVISDALADMLITPGSSTMIWTPPRAGKSKLTSQILPAWWETYRPYDRIVLTSYAERLSMRHTVAARGIMTSYGPQYGLTMSRAQATKSDWTLTTGGGMIARGVGSGLTGDDMHLGIIDDPVKDRAAAESETIRDGLWDWYSSVWLSRREPHTRELLVMTRWSKNDLAGRILTEQGRIEEGGRWRVIHLPAIALAPDAEKGIYADPLGRSPGEPLTHPKIDDGDVAAMLAHWTRQRSESVARDWNALYQGVPFDAEGALLTADDILAATRPAPASWRRVAVGVDPSGGGRDTAGVVAAGLDQDHHLWWLADKTARMTPFQWPRTACQLAHDVGADRIVYEQNFGGKMSEPLITQAWDELLREGAVTGLCPLVTPVVARKSKILRAEPIAQAVKTERAFFARGAGLKQLTNEWQMWEPGSSWSPGALDAGVHVATHLLPDLPRGASTSNPSKRRRDDARASGVNARRRAM